MSAPAAETFLSTVLQPVAHLSGIATHGRLSLNSPGFFAPCDTVTFPWAVAAAL